MRRARFIAAAIAVSTVCVVVAGCASERGDKVPAPMPVPTSSVSGTPSPQPSAEPERDPTFLPDGTALANHDYFDFVNQRLLKVNSNPSGAAIIENLVNAGFSKSDLEVTPDRTDQLGLPADSIQVAVRTSKDCLIGQFQAGTYSSVVGPPTNGDVCLIGKTAPVP